MALKLWVSLLDQMSLPELMSMETHSNSVKPAVRDYLQQHRLPKLIWVAYLQPRRGSTGLGALVGRPPQELVLRPYRSPKLSGQSESLVTHGSILKPRSPKLSDWPESLVTHGQGGAAALAMVELLRGRALRATIRCTDADESELIFNSCRRGGYPCRLKI